MSVKNERKIVETGDGSRTIYDPLTGDHYHSLHGALQEARHVFIDMGLKFLLRRQKQVRILEVGFGTGLNAWLTLNEVKDKSDVQIDYTGLEPFPISAEEVTALKYSNDSLYLELHDHSWEETHKIYGNRFSKKKTEILEFESDQLYDLIYFDAFAPSRQADMWTLDVFQKIQELSAPNTVLVSYCAQGQFRRNLQECGFTVEKLPGPPGKREMIRGIFNP